MINCIYNYYSMQYVHTFETHVTAQQRFNNAVSTADYDTVNILLKHPAVDPAADTNLALIRASELGHTKIVELLLADKRVDPAARNSVVMANASFGGHIAVIELLLADGRADPASYNNKFKRACCHRQVTAS